MIFTGRRWQETEGLKYEQLRSGDEVRLSYAGKEVIARVHKSPNYIPLVPGWTGTWSTSRINALDTKFNEISTYNKEDPAWTRLTGFSWKVDGTPYSVALPDPRFGECCP